jgi:TATA-box binding protein (TBP) (component of TFIID and TFIIIB)
MQEYTLTDKSNACAVLQRFDCAHVRITEPRATANVYASGSMGVTTSKSPQTARLAVNKLCAVIEAAGFAVDAETVDAVSDM